MQFDFKTSSPREIYNLMIGLIAPRPIALVTSLDAKGCVNAAPFSAFNYLCLDPPIIGLGVAAKNGEGDGLKDTARNIERSGDFVVNVVTEDLLQAMNVCAVDFPPDTSELREAKLNVGASTVVSVPRIKEAHAALECRLYQTLQPGAGKSRIILGEIVAVFIEDRFLDPKGPFVVSEGLHAIGRMNGMGNYVRTRNAFLRMPRISHEQWLKGERGQPPETA